MRVRGLVEKVQETSRVEASREEGSRSRVYSKMRRWEDAAARFVLFFFLNYDGF